MVDGHVQGSIDPWSGALATQRGVMGSFVGRGSAVEDLMGV